MKKVSGLTALTATLLLTGCAVAQDTPPPETQTEFSVDPNSVAGDFLRPGHVLPLVAKEGGVLRRAGHTEATVDLVRMAGLAPAGVLCEILNTAGDRADRGR